MDVSLLLIITGILVGLLLSPALGVAMIAIGIVILIWPKIRRM